MILGILQARMSSSRLPGKVLLPVAGIPILIQQVRRLKRSQKLDKLVVATSTHPEDDAIADLCASEKIACFRGDLNDVLDRFYQTAKIFNPKAIVRLTGDCPLADPDLIDELITFYHNGEFDYASNTIQPSFPDGLDAEILSYDALEKAWKNSKLSSEREHVTLYHRNHPSEFRLGNFQSKKNLSFLRWTVDEVKDLELIRIIYENLYPLNANFTTDDILSFLERNPELKTMNKQYERNEGLKKSRQRDFQSRYQKSIEFLDRACRTIPLGTQTFSKSKTQYPRGVSPHFIQRGQGSSVWDVDGNKYIDFASSLSSVTLGYSDPDVTAAVKKQLEDGVIFSLPHKLEFEVAELLIDMIPCAEMVRFGKNGSDATSGAIRLARAYTNRDRVAVCGYHGWQDWYIGSTARNKGVPRATRELTHAFPYNDLDALHKLLNEYRDQFAAVILEPMNVTEPKAGYLAEVKELARKHGAVLIFDETITGFRFSNGGAQEYFGVTPDLATFGKGMANGYPISAIAGRSDIMRLMEEIFFSFTFGGELLSLAASKAALTKLKSHGVITQLKERGSILLSGVNELLKKHELSDALSISGHPSWTFMNFKDVAPYTSWELKTLFLQEVFFRGVLTVGTHNISFAHSEDDVRFLLKTYNEVFEQITSVLREKDLQDRLFCKPLEPLFRIR